MQKKYIEKRFSFLNVPMIFRKRVRKSRGFGFESGEVFNQLHLGKTSLIFQKMKLKNPNRKVWNIANWSN